MIQLGVCANLTNKVNPFALKFEQTLAIACGIPKADSANSEYSANSGEYSAIQGATPGLTIIFR